MKLSKANLNRLTRVGLKNLGYHEIQDTITVAQGLYIKVVENDFYLTLGLTISNYYTNMFTASYYLSKTTLWGTYGGDIPKDSYQRIGHFLTLADRKRLLDKSQTQPGIRDAWWNAEFEMSINHFFEAIRITEKEFLNQPGLFVNIDNSKDVNEMDKLSKMVIDKIDDTDLIEYKYTPKKPIDGIPIKWFEVAEKIIIIENAFLNANTVKRLAADAWRRNLMMTDRISK